MAKDSFAEFLRLVNDDLIYTDLGDGEKIVLASGEAFEPLLQSLLQPLEPLARDAVFAIDLGQQILVQLQFVLDHLLFEGRGHGDEPERRMGDDDRIPGGGRRPRQEAGPLVLGEVRLIGDQNARVRIKRQELACGLGQAMARHDQHRLGDQAETALLHDRSRHRHRFPGADGMGEIGRAIGDDPPDAAFLVPIKNKGD